MSRRTLLPAWLCEHLSTWLDNNEPADTRDATLSAMLAYVVRHELGPDDINWRTVRERALGEVGRRERATT